MPKIDFCFEGWVRGAEITQVTDTKTRKVVDVSEMDAEELASGLEAGRYLISLGDYLYADHEDAEIELKDFDAA